MHTYTFIPCVFWVNKYYHSILALNNKINTAEIRNSDFEEQHKEFTENTKKTKLKPI